MTDAVLRTAIVLAAGLALRGALSRRSAAVRHAILLAAILGSAAVVPASLVTPAWTIVVPAPPAARPVAPAGPPPARRVTASAASAAAGAPERHVPLAPLVWGAGVLVALATLVVGRLRLARLSARATPVTDQRWLSPARAIASAYGLRGRITLLESDAPSLLATWGLWPARVLLPPHARHWSDQRIHVVLSHELAHVVRADWLAQLAAQLACATLWFNPLVWIACRQLRRDAEQACDDVVLDRGVGAADYAAHLVALAREGRRPAWPWMPALPMAHRSAFERRIAAMLNSRLDRKPLSRRAATAVAGVAIVATFAVAALHAVQAPPAALTGTVYDTTGAIVPGVAVTLEDASQRSSRATTDHEGRFSFSGIGSGHYVLSAELPGFRKLRDEFELKTAADWDRVVTLQLGTLQETISVRASRAALGSAPSGPVPIRVGGNVRVPTKTLDVRPVYPDSMRAAGREGQVAIDAIIGDDGSVSSVRVVSGPVHPDFAIAAADAVRQWRFTPTLLNGQPVEVVMTVTVRFSLSD